MRKSNFKDAKDEASSETRRTKAKQSRNSRYSKRGKKESKTSKEAGTNNASPINDPAWYSTSPELLRDAASIPFSWPTGTSRGRNELLQNDREPGICVLHLMQTIGSSNDHYSAANVASDAIYSFVRHANSGHSNYDAPDMMMYLLAISSVYSFITWCQRLLGVVMSYDQRNRYLPSAIVQANKVNYSSLRDNISNFRLWLNTYITKVTSFAVPGVMPYFNRMAFLYSNFYIDGPTIKDQFYMYKPFGNRFLKFSIDSTTHKGKLTYEPIPLNSGLGHTVSEIMNYGDQLFNAIWSQEDFGIMSGDILKAYGDNVIKLSLVPELFILQPVYDSMFLHQFKNAKIVGLNRVTVGEIWQDDGGCIRQAIEFNASMSADLKLALEKAWTTNFVLSSDFADPTPEVVIESSRLMPGYDKKEHEFICGSEMPINQTFYTLNPSDLDDPDYSLSEVDASYLMGPLDSESVIVTWENLLNAASKSKHFKYAPEMLIGEWLSTGPSDVFFDCWDIDNYALLDGEDLIQMHQVALMSMLAVPSIGKVS